MGSSSRINAFHNVFQITVCRIHVKTLERVLIQKRIILASAHSFGKGNNVQRMLVSMVSEVVTMIEVMIDLVVEPNHYCEILGLK